ncbi:hypothetical protein ACOMHN_066832 [Nucella lapillus]
MISYTCTPIQADTSHTAPVTDRLPATPGAAESQMLMISYTCTPIQADTSHTASVTDRLPATSGAAESQLLMISYTCTPIQADTSHTASVTDRLPATPGAAESQMLMISYTCTPIQADTSHTAPVTDRLPATPGQQSDMLMIVTHVGIHPVFDTTPVSHRLPATPGAAERQMAALRDLDSVSGRSGRPSTASSGRYSLCSTGSAKSVVFVPVGAGKLFACEDEPESPKFEWGRLNDLQRRTTLCAPPLRASPLDTQTVKGWQVDSHTLPHATVIGKGDKPGNPTSTPTPGSTGSRKRRPEAMDVDEEPTARRGASEAQTRKLARHGPIYQKPGPPTPLTDRHRKLSDPHLNSAAARKKACTPRKSPRVSPRRSPRVRARLRRFADENVMPQDAGRGSVSLEAGVSPSKTLSSSGRSLTRQKAFLSKSRLPLMARPGDYGDTPSPSPPTVAGSAAKAKSPTSSRHQPAQAKSQRKADLAGVL